MTYSAGQLKAMHPERISRCSERHVQSVIEELIETALGTAATIKESLTVQEKTASVPDGFVLVPVEPTQEMLSRAMKDCGGIGGGSCGEHTGVDWDDMRSVWASMLAASPQAPQPETQPRRLSSFDAVAEAMRLASLMGGSIGMSDVEKTRDYEVRLRSHLIEFMYPPETAAPSAQAEAQPHWIPMAERLPPARTPILICASDGTVCAATFEHEPGRDWIWWNGAGFGGPEWEWDWECISEPWRGVTHWMPLPAAPSAHAEQKGSE